MSQPFAANQLEFLRRRPGLWFSLGFGALLVALFADPLFVSRTFAGRDMLSFFLPIEKAVHDSWRHGSVPLSMPEVSFGRPLAANPNTGAFYPLRIAMAALPFPFALKFFPILHLWIAGMGAFALARLLEVSRGGAALSAVVFSLGGAAVSEVLFPDFLPGLALLPWVIWSAGTFSRAGSRRSAALFGLVLGLDLLVGDVFTAGLGFVGGLLITLQLAVPGRRLLAAGRLLVASVPAALLAGIQIVPALLYLPLTVRALGRFPLRAALAWSVSAWRLLEMLLPFPFGNMNAGKVWGEGLWGGKASGFFQTLYPGALASAFLLVVRPEPKKRLFVYGLLFVSLAASAAGFYCPHSWLSLASPIPLRYPEKLMVGVALSIAMIAGMGVDRLRTGEKNGVSRAMFAVAVLLGAAAALVRVEPRRFAAFVDRRWSPWVNHGLAASHELPRALFLSAVLWASWGALVRMPKGRILRGAGWMVLLSAAELGWLRFQLLRTTPESRALTPPPAVGAVQRENRGSAFGFMPFENYMKPERPRTMAEKEYDRLELSWDVAAAFGVFYSFNLDYDISDFYRVELARREIYRDDGRWPGLARYLGAFSARCALMDAGRVPSAFPVPVGGPIGRQWLVSNPAAQPTIRFAGRVKEVRSIRGAYKSVHDDRIDLGSWTVVETGRERTIQLGGGGIRVEEFSGRVVRLKTETAGPARVLVARAYSPFLEASLDGMPVEAEAANLCLTSIAIPAGTHRVVLRETLPGGATGAIVSLCGAIVLILLARPGEKAS